MKKINRWLTFFGFTILSITVLSLLGLSLYEAWLFHAIGGIISLILLIGALIAIITELKRLSAVNLSKWNAPDQFLQGVSVFSGGLVTFAVSHDLGLGPVIATSVIAILAYMIMPKYSVAVYCGSFVGMTSNLLFYNYGEVALASLIAAIVFIISRDVFNGFGGKLGTIALIGTAITCHSLDRDFLRFSIADFRTNLLIILVAVIAAGLTYYFNNHRSQGAVLASAVVSMLGAILLPSLFPNLGNNLTVVAICASFTGMTNQNRCPDFAIFLVTGVLTGIVFVYSTPLLGGAGGKLGTIAFSAVLSTCGYRRFFRWLAERKHNKANSV
jgi:hypothetical protein